MSIHSHVGVQVGIHPPVVGTGSLTMLLVGLLLGLGLVCLWWLLGKLLGLLSSSINLLAGLLVGLLLGWVFLVGLQLMVCI